MAGQEGAEVISVEGWFPRHIKFSASSVLLWIVGALVAASLLLPTFYLLVRAMEAGESAWRALLRPNMLYTLLRTVWLAFSVTLLSMFIAVPLAWLTVRSDLPGRRFWATVTPLPLVLPSYVGAYLLISALGPRGLLQQGLESLLGVERIPSLYGFPGALITLTLLSYPYLFLSVRSALLRIDPALEEASRSLGRNGWQSFGWVVLPLLRPALGSGGLLVALYTLRDFGAVALMRYDTFARVLYIQYQSFDRAQAAIPGLLLIAVTLLFVAFEGSLQRRARYTQGERGSLRPPAIVQLGWWRWPALIFCGLVVFFSLLLPTAMLIYWLVRGLLAGESMPTLAAATWNALFVSLLAALTTVLIALPVSWLVVRQPGRLSHLLERLTYSAYALPGIVIALALVFLGANHLPWLYQSIPLLIFGYMILFIPQAVSTIRSSLLQIHPSLEEAAHSLGKGSWRVFATITLPLLQPGLLAGAAMVFLTTMKELPATLLLAPTGFKTLAMAVWSSVSEAYFAAAAAPALLIVLMSSLPMTFLILREQNHDTDRRSM